MKLWVDDIRNAPDESWHVARTSVEAIRAIARFEFEVISLDHDISHQIHMDTLSRPYRCNETFASVVYFIREKYRGEFARHVYPYPEGVKAPVIKTPEIILHTSNQVAGDEMARVLAERGIGCTKKYMGAANRLEMEI